MKPQISRPDLDLVEEYIFNIKDGSFTKEYLSKKFLIQEISDILPTVRRIFEYGSFKDNTHIKNEDCDFSYLSNLVNQALFDRNYDKIRQVVIENRDLIQALIEDYKFRLDWQAKDKIFSKSIASMTGYEFQSYLKKIGLIK